jgi:hypothetical protein
MSQENMRPNLIRLLLLLLWFVFIASASLWLPAYEGDIDRSEITFAPAYAVIAGLAAITVRGRAHSGREAVQSAFPAVVMLGAAAAFGLLLNEQREDFRGGPLYLYFGVAVWASWTAVMLAAALLSWTKWDGFAGIGVGFLVAILGLLLFTAQVD